MIRYLLNSISFLLLCQCSFGQLRQYVFTRISSKEGLASDYVYSILQDKKGFMWFGTANGLQRYDGKKIIMFRTPESEGEYLPSVGISQTFEDKTGNFWVRSDKVLGIFDPATFRFRRATIHIEGGVPVRAEYALWEDSEGKVFVVLKRHGYYTYDSASHSFSTTNNPFRLPENWKPALITEDPLHENYWIATDSGLAVYNKKSKEIYYKGNNPRNIKLLENPVLNNSLTSFYIDKSFRAWIVSWPIGISGETIYCYDLRSEKLLPDAKGIKEATSRYHELHGFFEQQNNKLWAHGRMLFLERDSSQHRFNYIRNPHQEDYGLKYDVVHTMYEDREKNLWLGTDQGVYVFNPSEQKFNSIDLINLVDKTDEERTVTSFVQSENKEIWVGTWGKGVLAYDSNFRPVANSINSRAVSSEYELVWAMNKESRSKRIWIGCQSGRLIVHDQLSRKTQYLQPRIFENKTIRQIVEDKNGNIWLGTQYGHLVKWSPDEGIADIEKGFSRLQYFNAIIYRLFVADDGYLWVCTHESGVYKIDPANGKIVAQYNSKGAEGKSLQNDIAADIIQYNDSIFIVSTGILNVINQYTGNIRFITAFNGLPSNTVRSMAKDQQGTIWLGMISSLSRYNFRKNIFTKFTQRDGVINNDFHSAANYRTEEGMMLFGTERDFIFFKPELITPSSAPPDVSITDFKLFNSYLPPDSIIKLNKVRMNHNQNSITIEFAALSFLQKDKIVYYYMLEGIDEGWIRSESMLTANYTLLPPGNYVFKVYCENGEGIVSENITTLKIYIKPPFWRTWWFLLLMVLAAAGLIYLAHRVRVNRILTMERVRTRIARDLHDDMGSTLSTINILSEMAKMKVNKDAEKTGEYLNKISDNSSRMMEAMDDIVWSINPMNDNMIKITARMREFATGVLEAKNIEFIFRVDEEVKELKLDMEARRDFFLLFKEAVNNLAKYSDCRHATIDISVNRSKLIMKVQDDGVGFNVETADSGNGLTNMRKRAQSLGGILQINSIPGEGSIVSLEVNLN